MTDDNVIVFEKETLLDIPCDRVLTAAVGKLDRVLILGTDTDGKFYFASSTSDIKQSTFVAQRFIHWAMQQCDNAENEA